MKGYILFLLLVTFSLSFKISDISFQPSFKKVVSKFGEVFLHHNTTEYEEVVFEGETTHDGQDYKGAYDTILDVTKNPERQKEFLDNCLMSSPSFLLMVMAKSLKRPK